MKVREELPEKYKWDLTDLYPSDEAWKAEKERLQGEIEQITKYKGRLTDSAATLLEALELNTRLAKELVRLMCYANMMSDQDTRETKYVGMTQEVEQLFSQFGALTSFMEPELLSMEEANLEKLLQEESGLQTFAFYLRDLLRKRAHRGSEEVERVMAYASLMSNNAA